MKTLKKLLAIGALGLASLVGCTNYHQQLEQVEQLEQEVEYCKRTIQTYQTLLDNHMELNEGLERENEQLIRQRERNRKIDELRETYPRPRKQPNTITL